MPARKRPKAKYNRILLKLSGEVLRDPASDSPVHPGAVAAVARRIKNIHKLGVEIGIVLGGGNIIRGAGDSAKGIGRINGDYMGMLATVINAVALADALVAAGVDTRVMTAVKIDKIGELVNADQALKHLKKGRIVIFAGGTGNPFFTTDTAAALRASEIGADVLLKATKVDGVYDSDPMKNKGAKRFSTLSYEDALSKGLKVMDASAFSLCMENQIPIVVFNFFKAGSLKKAITGATASGTLVC
jgi:uridylate kinase